MLSSTPSRSRWLVTLIPVTVSIAMSIILAFATSNPLNLLFGLMMPMMMLAPALERWFELRRARQALLDEIRAETLRYPSPRELLAFGRRRVPDWSLPPVGAAQIDKCVRLGSEPSGRVLRVDVSGGVNIVGDLMRREGVARAITCSLLWKQGPSSDPARVSVEDKGARWLVGVHPDGSGIVMDRLGLEVDHQNVKLDTLTTSDHERFVDLMNHHQTTNQLDSVGWDLVAEGPHALVSGVTGSGKTELLRQWIMLLATDTSTPAIVGVIDFKGGGGFGDLVANGCVAGLATNLDPTAVELALGGLRALLVRRATLLGEHSCLVLDEVSSDARPPRVVIIVDEYRALLDAFPQAHHLFVDIAARGRALGVHLILATQRFSGVAGDALTSNCGIRVALRAGDPTESRQVIGTADACDSRLRPGEGFVVVPGHPIRRLNLERVGAPEPLSVTGRGSGLWLEPLVDIPTWRELGESPFRRSRVRLGLVDDHESLSRSILECDEHTQAFVLVGGERDARDGLLTVIGQQLNVATLPTDAAGAWDALAAVSAPTGFVIHNLDAIESELLLAWREAFIDLVMSRARSALAAGLPFAMSVVNDGNIARQLRNLPHRLIDLSGKLPSLNGQSFLAARPVPESNEAAITLETIHEFCDCLVVSPHATSWRARQIRGITVADVEDVVFGRVNPAQFTRVYLDGCSPMDARSMRLSAEHIPPPQPGTILEVDAFGRYCRWAVSSDAVSAIEL